MREEWSRNTSTTNGGGVSRDCHKYLCGASFNNEAGKNYTLGRIFEIILILLLIRLDTVLI